MNPAHGLNIDVRRSARRKRTVSAYRNGDTIVVMIPARMTKSEEREWVATMVDRITKSEGRRHLDDSELAKRATSLSDRYLEGLAVALSVRWVTNQNNRWGSCTPADGSIRLSTRLQGLPAYVIDYVLLHELTHLLEPGHGKEFWSWVHRYELSERGRGFLEGMSAAGNRGDASSHDSPLDGAPVDDAPSPVSPVTPAHTATAPK